MVNLSSTLGAAFFGFMAASMLYALTCVQTFAYFRRSDRDGNILKTLIGVLWVLDTLHLAFVTHAMYTYLIIDFASPFAILRPVWSLIVQEVVSAIIEFCVRGVFIVRIHKLSGWNWRLSGFLAIMNVVVFAIGIYFGYKAFHYRFFTDFQASWIVYLVFTLGMVTDTAITACICTLLARSRTGHAVSDRLVHSVMRYVINAGVITSVISLAVLVTYAAMPDSFVFIAIYFVLAKSFLNSLLASLNARSKILNRRGEFSSGPDGFGLGAKGHGLAGPPDGVSLGRLTHLTVPRGERSQGVVVQMTTTTSAVADGDEMGMETDGEDGDSPRKTAPEWADGWKLGARPPGGGDVHKAGDKV